MRPAPHLRRLAAALFDLAMVFFVPLLVFLAFVLLGHGLSDGLSWKLALALGLSLLTVPLVAIAYLAMMRRPGRHNGQSLGKQIFALRVVRDDGEPVGWGTVFYRELVVIGLVFGLLDLVIPVVPLAGQLIDLGAAFFDGQHRALHDRICKTRVVVA